MAFPGDVLSTVPVPGAFIGAGGEALISRTFDFEDGPIALQDPTKGMDYQQWRAYIKDEKVWIEADNLAPSVLLNPTGNTITDISICFSQNADLHYAWVDAGVARFRWYDTLTAQFQTMTLPSGAATPKCTLDDKRTSQTGRSDIILSYIKSDGGLYFRKQRDRFGVEYLLDAGPFISIEKLYMNSGLRLQWELVKLNAPKP